MKCAKCGYLGFESGDRCRNCGYEFSLGRTVDAPDLEIRSDADATEGLDDFPLTDAANARAGAKNSGAGSEAGSDADRPPTPVRSFRPAGSGAVLAELPLFGRPIDDDRPLITKPSPPRPPLAVRRSTPDVARVRTLVPKAVSPELGLEDLPRAAPRSGLSDFTPPEEHIDRQVDHQADSAQRFEAAFEAASVPRRLAAAALDGAILLVTDIAVIYLTMQICSVTLAEFGLLPKGPLVAFLAVQNVGYLVAFTAGGQTLGKMAAGIKVVADDPRELVDLGRALKRTVAWLMLALPAGLGLLPAFFSHDHRGLHDRFAGTRVVRASAWS